MLPIVQVTQAPPVVEMRSKGLVDVVVTGLLWELSLLQLLPRIATNKYAAQSYCIALIHNVIGRASGSRYTARLGTTGGDLGTGHKNNIRWMTDVTSD